tara:strand:+ start:294 stop:1514 length:1221 start_codon:yes stop_codon:yes gene_type:complete
MNLDIDFVREQFPAFQTDKLNGQAFFQSAGGSYACRQVIRRLSRFYEERKVQPYDPYEASTLGGNEMDEARVGLANFMGVKVEEVSFGPSTTQNTYVLSQAFKQWMKPGEAIIVTNQDHEANSGPWRRLSEAGIEVREWCINPETGSLEVPELERLLDNKVRLVCFPHCSNVIGEINDVKKIVAVIHGAGAVSCVDGVSYAPHGLPDVGALNTDIYLFSAYKTFGPHQGIMVIREDLGFSLPNQGHYFNEKTLYSRFTPAGPDHAQVAACAGITEYFDDIIGHHIKDSSGINRANAVHDLFRDHEARLLQPLLDYVSAKNSVRLIGPADAQKRAPTVSLEVQESSNDLAAQLATRNVMAAGGDFYGGRPLKAMNVDTDVGVLRLSFVHYNTKSEVDHLISTLDDVI